MKVNFNEFKRQFANLIKHNLSQDDYSELEHDLYVAYKEMWEEDVKEFLKLYIIDAMMDSHNYQIK